LDKISKGLFNENYSEVSFNFFSKVITENLQTLLELLVGLQKARENPRINKFLATCYKLVFRYSEKVKPFIGSMVTFLCEIKAQLPTSSSSGLKITILNTLNDIASDQIQSAVSILQNYKLLLRSLDLFKTKLTFTEHRCSLFFGLQVRLQKGVQE
jgi:hypothetical protein